MAWGAFLYHGVGDLVLLSVKKTLNRFGYLDILYDYGDSSMEKCNAKIFQQDGATCHTAQIVIEHFRENGVPLLENWPGSSPDLSPIENLWGILKAKLRKTSVTSVDHMKMLLLDAWEKCPRKYVKSCLILLQDVSTKYLKLMAILISLIK